MKKLLVTGASGFLGWNLCRLASESWKTYGVYNSHSLTIDTVTMVKVDLRDVEAMQNLVDIIKPDAVIHCAAMPDPNTCERNPEESYQVNVVASVNLAAYCATLRVPLVFVSTDLVFDGEHAPYVETDIVEPMSVYGKHKVAAEQKMRAIYTNVTICRVPVMFGDPGPCSKSFIQPLLANLLSGKKCTLFTDEFRTPVSGKTAAAALLMAIDNPGMVIHCGGRQRISRYDFGLLLCKARGADERLIVPVSQKEIASPAKRPRDVSLVSDIAYRMGYNPLSLDLQLSELECIRKNGAVL